MEPTKEIQNVSANVLQTLQQDIKEIKIALLGNEYNPTSGLLYRMTEAEKQVEKLRTRFDRMVWTAIGVASVLSVIFNILMAYFDKIIMR